MRQDYTVQSVPYQVTLDHEEREYTVMVQRMDEEPGVREAMLSTHDREEASAYYAYLCARLEEASDV